MIPEKFNALKTSLLQFLYRNYYNKERGLIDNLYLVPAINQFNEEYPHYGGVPTIIIRQLLNCANGKPLDTAKAELRAIKEEDLQIRTRPDEFAKFHKLLMQNAPDGYVPYYILLEPNTKEPAGGMRWKPWTDKEGNQHTSKIGFEKALRLMTSGFDTGFNIGIAGTDTDKLVNVDVDDRSLVPEIKHTLQVTSRKRLGCHNFFFATDNTYKINIPTGTAGEVRSNWQYVVACGSFVPCSLEEVMRIPEADRINAGRYSLSIAEPASPLTFSELPEVYRKKYREEQKAKLLEKPKPQGNLMTRFDEHAGKNTSALWGLKISDVLGFCYSSSARFPMPAEIHGSETGGNASFSEDGSLLYCWRHFVSHNALSYLAVCAGVASCETAGAPFKGGKTHVDMKDGKTVFNIWIEAKRRNLIPANDPIPSVALVYYAISKGFCKQTDLIDGWKLPNKVYINALNSIKMDGFK